MSLDERIHELCSRIELSRDPDEVCELTGLLKAALHVKIHDLTNSIAAVIRNTPYRSLLDLGDTTAAHSERRPPVSDYSAA
jgi:hypothetical protein